MLFSWHVELADPAVVCCVAIRWQTAEESRAPQDQLVTACSRGDILTVASLIEIGASANDTGTTPRGGTVLPLVAAVLKCHYSVAALMLSRGADPNGFDVMYVGTYYSSPEILQLLIDAGGDVNKGVGELLEPPLMSVANGGGRVAEKVRSFCQCSWCGTDDWFNRSSLRLTGKFEIIRFNRLVVIMTLDLSARSRRF